MGHTTVNHCPPNMSYISAASTQQKAFCLDQTEVTQKEIKALSPELWKQINSRLSSLSQNFRKIIEGDQKPAVMITRDEAQAFCNLRYPKKGTLPTNEQWGRACGSQTACTPSGKLRVQDASGNWREIANYRSEGPKNVGSYPANAKGFYDLTGNVAEWTSTRAPDLVDFAGRTYTQYFTRGGSWKNSGDLPKIDMQMLNPTHANPEVGFNIYVGFRCAYSVE